MNDITSGIFTYQCNTEVKMTNLTYFLVVSSNPANGEVYSIQHYMIKSVSGFSINTTERDEISEILLKVALNTITLTITLKTNEGYIIENI
jgi:hypothetical protein